MKTIWKSIACRIWLIVTPVVLAITIVLNVLASATFFDAIATVLGRETTKIVGEEESRYELDDGIENKADALAYGNAVSKEICEEGFVLLKNKDGALPLASGAKISVFGKNSVNLAVGGSGSGGGVTADYDLFDSLTAAGFEYNDKLVEFYKDDARSGSGRSGNPTDLDSGNEVELEIGETPVSDYPTDLWSTCTAYSDAALIVLTRIGGEGFDLPRSSNGSHSLQLTKDESDLIDKVSTMHFKSVVVVLNTVTTMELKEVNENDGVDAILWIGYTGGQGIMALGEVLKGEVTPSGKTVDTWASDFTHSPVWENFGAALGGDAYKFQTTDARTGRPKLTSETVYFVDYEEGIYVGYRYYETRYSSYDGPLTAIGESSALAGADDWYAEEVVYPFGYGLSYTEFEWELENADEVNGFVWDEGKPLTVKVRVTNTGDYAGKDVVQLYVTAPYTEGGIEKSAKVLVGFAKTNLLQSGQSEIVELTINSPYDFASYDCYDANGNGFKGYEAEAGEYVFTVGTDAHNGVFTLNTSLNNDIKYEKDPVTGAVVTNLYTDCEDECDNADAELINGVLSRADWTGTWPARRTDEEKIKTTDWINGIKSEDSVTNRPEPEGGYSMPVTGANNGITLDELVGLDYYDEKWEKFLDQLTLNEMAALLNEGAFHTTAIQRLQVPQTTSSDGPVGFVNFIGAPEIYGTCAYPSEVVAGSTWNTQLIKKMGQAVGNEALIGNEDGDGAPYSGWYAPGLNLHRSPFGGRNYEYYSEDSFLSGKMTAAIVEGCADRGVYVTMKHLALNDQETHRSINGVLTWATEQSMREIYLKAFEIAVKAVNAYAEEQGREIPLAAMSSFNRIGERWTGGDYRLLNTILRDEWGFEGLVISD
ncbi:MAG: glycoside hydrolase family 3 C-terminal domain-containing protein, partial [Candidatus Coproplasma sp.]